MLVICPECIKQMKVSVKPIYIEHETNGHIEKGIITQCKHYRCNCGRTLLTNTQSKHALRKLYEVVKDV